MANSRHKFRAWDTEKEKMQEVVTLDFFSGNVNDDEFYNMKPLFDFNCILMQYIGLKDKNDKEIYEGDIVKYLKHKRIYHDYEYESACVEYNERKCRFELNKGNGNNETFCSFSKFGTNDEQVEVIGNIYEHPHLLKDDTQ